MSVARLLHKLRTRPLVGGLALGETLKITTNVKRARKPVKGSLDEIDTPNFSSPKDLIEHLMTTVSIAVREHDKFAEIVEGIKTDPNVYERYRSMSKTAVTKAVSSEILGAMVSDHKELLEEGKKLKEDLDKLNRAVRILKARPTHSKTELKRLELAAKDARGLLKEYNREHANLSKGIKKIGLDSDDPVLVKALGKQKMAIELTSKIYQQEGMKPTILEIMEAMIEKYSSRTRDNVKKAVAKEIIALKADPLSKEAQDDFLNALDVYNKRRLKFYPHVPTYRAMLQRVNAGEDVIVESVPAADDPATNPLDAADDPATNPLDAADDSAEVFGDPEALPAAEEESDGPVEAGGLRYLKTPKLVVKRPRAKKVVMKL